MYSDQQDIDECSAYWAKRISDPPPEPNIFNNWLNRYGYKAVLYAVGATVRRYDRGGIDYAGCLRFCAAVARRKQTEDNEFKVPATWT